MKKYVLALVLICGCKGQYTLQPPESIKCPLCDKTAKLDEITVYHFCYRHVVSANEDHKILLGREDLLLREAEKDFVPHRPEIAVEKND